MNNKKAARTLANVTRFDIAVSNSELILVYVFLLLFFAFFIYGLILYTMRINTSLWKIMAVSVPLGIVTTASGGFLLGFVLDSLVRRSKWWKKINSRVVAYETILQHAQTCPYEGDLQAMIMHLNNCLRSLRRSDNLSTNKNVADANNQFHEEFTKLHFALKDLGVAESPDWNYYNK
jgi:hypothetical protein